MPSLVTHALAAHRMIDTNLPLATHINNAPKAFSIGSSGPDLFYFYHTFPWSDKQNKTTLYNLGTEFHFHKINEAFQKALIISKESKNSIMISYTAGWLAHYALDQKAHPYIFYFSGAEGGNHRRFEAAIDAHMLNELLNTSIKHFKPYEILDYDAATIEAIYRLYAPITKEIFATEISELIVKESIRDMRQSYRILHDPHHLKFQLISHIEKHPYDLTGTIIPSVCDTQHDILNKDHTEWCNPCDQILRSNADFLTLFNEGIAYGKELLKAYDSYLSDAIDIDEVLKLIGNKDYCSGLADAPAMVYYDCIYK